MDWTKVFSDTKTELIVYSETQVYPVYLIQSRTYESRADRSWFPVVCLPGASVPRSEGPVLRYRTDRLAGDPYGNDSALADVSWELLKARGLGLLTCRGPSQDQARAFLFFNLTDRSIWALLQVVVQ